MTRRSLAALWFLLAAALSVRAQPAAWIDPSPHAVKFVRVDDDVRREVLDWGGSGQPIVLLAGLGDPAHVFDDFAPMLAKQYRVIGVTRRGHGRSSAPPSGYGFERLAEDVVHVIDSAGIAKPVIVGHSFAGEEMHVLGARDSNKVAGLVYVDAAFNRGDDSDNEAYDAVARTLPVAPRAGPGDLSSYAALASFLTKSQGFAGPEAYLRARWVGNADGTVARMWAPDMAIRQAMTKEMQAAYKPYKPERIRVPALAIYAEPASPADLTRPWYPAEDPGLRERVGSLFRLQRERVEHHITWFQNFAEGGRVARIAGAHHLFLSHPREVLRHIDTFVSSLR